MALVVELNNIFLHFRQLLNIAKVSKDSLVYRINCWINLGNLIIFFGWYKIFTTDDLTVSFIVFRVFTLVWLGKCLVDHRHVVPLFIHGTATTCLVAVSVMTTIMFTRLVQADLFTKSIADANFTNGSVLKSNSSNGSISDNANHQNGSSNGKISRPESNGTSTTSYPIRRLNLPEQSINE